MSGIGLWVALPASAMLYALGVRRAAGWPWSRTASWLAGLVVIGAALLSPLDAAAETHMRAHMAQHLLLIVLAPPLLLGGAPLALLLRAAPSTRRGVARLLHARAVRVLLHPACALLLFTLAVAGSHLPVLYDAALDHPPLHELEHALYLATALLFWTVVLGMRPLPHRRSPLVRLLVLLLAMPPMALVGVLIMSTSQPIYAHYALGDQHGAGRLMWVGGTLPMGAAVMVLAILGVNEEERRQLRRDQYDRRRAQGTAL